MGFSKKCATLFFNQKTATENIHITAESFRFVNCNFHPNEKDGISIGSNSKNKDLPSDQL